MIVLEDGRPIERNLKRERLTMEDIAEEARKQSIADLEEVRYAVLETNGQLSFIKKDS